MSKLIKLAINIALFVAGFLFLNHFADQAAAQFNKGTNALANIADGP